MISRRSARARRRPSGSGSVGAQTGYYRFDHSGPRGAETPITIQRFPARPESVGLVRRLVSSLVSGLTGTATGDAARLLTSELVTNTLRHGDLHPEDELVVRIAVTNAAVRVEAFDRSRGQPRRRRPEVTDGSGRGVALIDDLARKWGTTSDEHGKWVWFELAF